MTKADARAGDSLTLQEPPDAHSGPTGLYQFELSRGDANWIGIANLRAGRGELCMVNRTDEKAAPERKPVEATFVPDGKLRITIPEPLSAENTEKSNIYERSQITGSALAFWGIDQEMWGPDAWDSTEARWEGFPGYLVRLPAVPHRLAPMHPHASLGDSYVGISPEEAIALTAEENPHEADGVIVGVIESQNLTLLNSRLREVGDGARVLNARLAECGAPIFATYIEVPTQLERWYAAKLRSEKLALTSYAIGLDNDAGWSAIALVSARIMSAYANPRVPFAQKDRVIDQLLQNSLSRFARARNPNFARQGAIVRRRSGSRTAWVYEIRGPGLVECSRPRWELLEIHFIIVQASSESRSLDFDVNTIEGYFAPGGSRPSEQRLKDNRINDEQLRRFQDILLGHMLANGFNPSDTAELSPLRNVRC